MEDKLLAGLKHFCLLDVLQYDTYVDDAKDGESVPSLQIELKPNTEEGGQYVNTGIMLQRGDKVK